MFGLDRADPRSPDTSRYHARCAPLYASLCSSRFPVLSLYTSSTSLLPLCSPLLPTSSSNADSGRRRRSGGTSVDRGGHPTTSLLPEVTTSAGFMDGLALGSVLHETGTFLSSVWVFFFVRCFTFRKAEEIRGA